MPECNHCGEEFDDEGAYVDHLASEHEGDLSRIERRRVEDRQGEDGGGISRLAIVVGGVGIIVAVALVAVFVIGGGAGECTDPQYTYDGDLSAIESAPLMTQGNCQLLAGVESFPDNGRQHRPASEVSYDRFPPLSGPHAPTAVGAGFYERTFPLPNLVHSLEHGQVVIYYDPAAISNDTRESLRAFAANHQRAWASVVVVPNPNVDPQAPIVLTAWRHQLTLDQYDRRTVYSFLSEYLGRGPENPVRTQGGG